VPKGGYGQVFFWTFLAVLRVACRGASRSFTFVIVRRWSSGFLSKFLSRLVRIISVSILAPRPHLLYNVIYYREVSICLACSFTIVVHFHLQAINRGGSLRAT
jgi:hypothetical protein